MLGIGCYIAQFINSLENARKIYYCGNAGCLQIAVFVEHR